MAPLDRPGLEELRSIHLFSALSEDELARIAATARAYRLAGGERLFDLGEPARQFFYLRDGLLKLYRLSPEGVEKVIWFVRPHETFAEAIMFMERVSGYPVSAEALAPSEVLGFDSATMVTLMRGSIDTCFRMMAAMSRRLRQQVEEIDRLTLHNATFRLATFLLQQIPKGVVESPELVLTLPKHELASRLGVQPETFSRILARLARDGLIRTERHSIVLLDIDGLRRLAAS